MAVASIVCFTNIKNLGQGNLGVSHTATTSEIKAAYYEKTKLYHPDVVSPTEESLNLFRQISEAYNVLGNPVTRKEYDETYLGLESQADILDDPIERYKSRLSKEDVSFQWTKRHCDNLRKQQKTHHHLGITKNNEADSDYTMRGILYLCLILVLIFFIRSNEERERKKKQAS